MNFTTNFNYPSQSIDVVHKYRCKFLNVERDDIYVNLNNNEILFLKKNCKWIREPSSAIQTITGKTFSILRICFSKTLLIGKKQFSGHCPTGHLF